MSDQLQNISAKLDQLRPELTAFLAKLVQFRSLPGHEQDAQHFYAGKLRSLGLETEVVPSCAKSWRNIRLSATTACRSKIA